MYVVSNPEEFNDVATIINSTGIVPAQPNEPQNPVLGQLWFDTATGVLKQWNGTAWVPYSGGVSAEWLFGTGVPANTLGSDGQIYYATDTANVYKKASGAWVFQFTIIAAASSVAWTNVTGKPAFYYEHPFSDSTNIVINHNLGIKPSGIRVVDSGGTQWYGFNVVYTDLNNLTISFASLFGGSVYLS